MARIPETQPTSAADSATPPTTDAAHLPGPSGIGTATAFDWAIGFQLLTEAALLVAGRYAPTSMGSSGMGMSTGMGTTPGVFPRAAELVGLLVAAGIVFGFGEFVRRGNKLAWVLQLLLCSATTLVGLIELPGTLADLQHGQFSNLPTEIALLIVSPVIVALLSRRNTRAWVGHVPSEVARARHGGKWVYGILAWALVGGVLVALGQARVF